ncbi:THAP domain-containing protein 2-like [Rhopalosiphum maidis]|uniref:THAP domain-containing protein 2-like n=1 Tax=Rhopalosiphum maidis TaxID=43146 RepID=UPI000EFDC1D7|nr:THAP domain-containing protein 2-like [Rhopalosiphum maidis]
MVNSCVVCYANSDNSKSVSFHKFPQDEIRKKLWIKILGLKDRKKPITRSHKVCSKHFSPESFSFNSTEKKILYSDAIPVSIDQIIEALRIVRQRHEEVSDCSYIALTES